MKPPRVVYGLSAFWYALRDLFPTVPAQHNSMDVRVADLQVRVRQYCTTSQEPQKKRSSLQVGGG